MSNLRFNQIFEKIRKKRDKLIKDNKNLLDNDRYSYHMNCNKIEELNWFLNLLKRLKNK